MKHVALKWVFGELHVLARKLVSPFGNPAAPPNGPTQLNFLRNGPFPSYLVPLFENESSCKTYVWFSTRIAFDTH